MWIISCLTNPNTLSAYIDAEPNKPNPANNQSTYSAGVAAADPGLPVRRRLEYVRPTKASATIILLILDIVNLFYFLLSESSIFLIKK